MRTQTSSVNLMSDVFTTPLSGGDLSSPPDTDAPCTAYRRLKTDHPRVDVSSIPCWDAACRHQLFVEGGTWLNKLDLPATSCVAVGQRFEASAGDTLTFDYVVLLRSSGRFAAGCPAVQAVLVDRVEESAVSLMERSIDGGSVPHQRHVGSRSRESKSFTMPADGHYELRFITCVDGSQPGSEVHLLVDAIRVVNAAGQEVDRLASLSCIGRVRRQLSN